MSELVPALPALARTATGAGGGVIPALVAGGGILVRAAARNRLGPAAGAGRRSPLGPHRSACAADPGAGGAHARSHARGAPGGPGRVGVTIGTASLWRLLDRRRLTRKKTAHAAEQDRPDVLTRRWDWFEGQLDLAPERLVFVDGRAPAAIDGASIKMARTHGRSLRGERLRADIPHVHWKTTTFVAGLRSRPASTSSSASPA